MGLSSNMHYISLILTPPIRVCNTIPDVILAGCTLLLSPRAQILLCEAAVNACTPADVTSLSCCNP